MNMYERFNMMAQFKGKSVHECCKDIGIAPSTITSWKTRNNLPNGDMAIKIADYFGTSTDFVLGHETDNTDIDMKYSFEEFELIEKHRKLNDEKRKQILMMYAFLLSRKDDEQ